MTCMLASRRSQKLPTSRCGLRPANPTTSTLRHIRLDCSRDIAVGREFLGKVAIDRSSNQSDWGISKEVWRDRGQCRASTSPSQDAICNSVRRSERCSIRISRSVRINIPDGVAVPIGPCVGCRLCFRLAFQAFVAPSFTMVCRSAYV